MNSNPVRFIDPSGHCIDPDSCPPWATTTTPSSSSTNPPEQPSTTMDDPSLPNPNDVFKPPSNSGSCTESAPCLSQWETPSGWDTDPSNPDYYTLTITGGEGLVGEVVFTVDRYGQLYVGFGAGVGVGTPVSVSATAGFIDTNYNINSPSGPTVTQNFIGGSYGNASAGFIGGLGTTMTFNGSNTTAYEMGVFTPSATLSMGFLTPIFQP